MIGILVDTTIIKVLINKFIPNLSDIIEEKNDYLGDFIGNNFINRGLTDIFSSGMIDREVSLLIWDYLFIEGNIVLLKSFLAIYYYLYDILLNGEKSIEFYNQVINNEIKKLKINNEDFIFNLFFKNDNTISGIDFNEFRFYLSLQVADSLEDQNIEHVKSKVKLNYNSSLYDKQMDKTLTCNKKWPYCINDTYFENVTRTVFFTVFHETENKYIKNYFFSDQKEEEEKKKENKTIDNNKFYKIIIERRNHYCSEILEKKSKEENNNENKKEIQSKIEIMENQNNKSDKNEELEEIEKFDRLRRRATTRKNFVFATKAIAQKIDMHINNNIQKEDN